MESDLLNNFVFLGKSLVYGLIIYLLLKSFVNNKKNKYPLPLGMEMSSNSIIPAYYKLIQEKSIIMFDEFNKEIDVLVEKSEDINETFFMLFDLALYYNHSSDKRNARKWYKKIIQLSGNKYAFEKLLAEAEIELLEGRNLLAYTNFLGAYFLKPDNFFVNLSLGEYYLKCKDKEKGQEHLEAAHKSLSRSRIPITLLLGLALEKKDYDLANKYCDKLGVNSSEIKEIRKMIKDEKEKSNSKEYIEYEKFFNLYSEYMRKEPQDEELIIKMEEIINNFDNNQLKANSFFTISQIFFMKNNVAKSKEYYNKSLENTTEDNFLYHICKGEIFFIENDIKSAINSFKNAQKMNDNYLTNFCLGKAFFMSASNDKDSCKLAIEYFNKALKYDSNNHIATYYLIFLYIYNKEKNMALDKSKNLIFKGIYFPGIAEILYYLEGKKKKAKKDYNDNECKKGLPNFLYKNVKKLIIEDKFVI